MSKYIVLLVCFFGLVGCKTINRVSSFLGVSRELPTNFSDHENDQLINTAEQFNGIPYRAGGSNDDGMDCSGLLFRVYSTNKFEIPRISSQQALFGLSVPLTKIQRGDWLFFRTNGSVTINHIGLVTSVKGDNEVTFIHASTSKGVRSDQLYAKYWFKAFDKAIRPFKNNSN
jgi:cell wall-associated NlpC family hydrolase